MRELLRDTKIDFVGNIKKHKGLYILIDAFIIAKNHGYKPKLLIVGNAENFRTSDESVFSLIKEAPKNSIEFTGKISDEKLKQLYKNQEILILKTILFITKYFIHLIVSQNYW